MFQGIKSIIGRNSIDTLASLRAELPQARARAALAEAAYGDALIQQTSVSGSDLDRLLQAMEDAHAEVRRLELAIKAAQARHQRAEADALNEKLGRAWDAAITVAQARAKAAAQLHKSMGQFARDYQALCEATDALASALPTIKDPDGAHLRKWQIETSTRQGLRKLGVNWAADAPWGVPSLPEFLPPFEGTEGLVRTWRDSALVDR